MALKNVPFCPLEQRSSPIMPRGRPRNRPRNMLASVGLRRQHQTIPIVSKLDEYHKPCAQGGIWWSKIWLQAGQHEDESDIDDELEWEGLHDEEFGRKLVAMSCNRDEDSWAAAKENKEMCGGAQT